MADQRFVVDAFSEIASRYEQTMDAEMQNFWGWSYDGFVENMLRYTPIRKDDRVLDVASGTAVIPLKLIGQNKAQGQIVGLDITYAMLKKGQQKVQQHGSDGRITFTCGNALAMPFKERSFDVILCGLAIHHMDAGILLDEMWRLLRPGGRFTIADVSGNSVWQKPLAKNAIRTATFLYFLPKEGYARARVEADALFNVLTPDEWEARLALRQFDQICVEQLPKKRAWVPAPIMIRAQKSQ